MIEKIWKWLDKNTVKALLILALVFAALAAANGVRGAHYRATHYTLPVVCDNCLQVTKYWIPKGEPAQGTEVDTECDNCGRHLEGVWGAQ